jgi:hypothetical protein
MREAVRYHDLHCCVIQRDRVNSKGGESYQVTNNRTFTHRYSHSAKFISKGGAENYLSHFLFLITVTPDGTVRHQLEEFIYDGCEG